MWAWSNTRRAERATQAFAGLHKHKVAPYSALGLSRSCWSFKGGICMRAPLRLAALSAAVIGCIPFGAHAQLEEILVTATRRETDLQSTPISIQAFTAQQLEVGGITNGRDLGIMVPNVVLNPGTGGAQSNFYIRGLP